MKRKFFALSALLLIPALALFGCDPTNTFKITTGPSSSELGQAAGGSDTPFDEGTKITLRATNHYATNPFLCWVKNYTTIESFESEFTLTVSENTQGDYRAVFMQNPAQMKYATVSKLSYVGGEAFSKFDYRISYAPTNDLDNVYIICAGQQSQNDMTVFDKGVFYFDKITESAFAFTIKVDSTTADGASTFNNEYQCTISNQDFDGQSDFVFKTDDGKFEIQFSKLSTSLMPSE